MKNLHVIATDKPSRLFIIDKSKMFLSEPPHLSFSTVGGKVHKIEGSELYQPQNMYITSDEEIKEGDWCINLNSPYKHKELCRIDNQIELERYAKKIGNNCKKIILTTDQDLINDGVQAIDDEFLEWFVNNPSCEEVEVKLENYYASGALQPNLWQYKIIISKDEPKQETLEEVAERYSKKSSASVFQEAHKRDFIEGAKWQAERSYSEEEVTQLLIKFNQEIYEVEDVRGWFEQNKKK